MNKMIRVIENGKEIELTDKVIKKIKLDRAMDSTALNKIIISKQSQTK